MGKQTTFKPNPRYFETVLRQPRVERLVDGIAAEGLAIAKADAPRDTAAYVNGLRIEHHESRYRRTARVVGSDKKTMLLESKLGILARMLKKVKR